MRNNRKTRPSPRGLLAGQGAGKGSAPRHTLNAEWQANYDAIDWGCKTKRIKASKVYDPEFEFGRYNDLQDNIY